MKNPDARRPQQLGALVNQWRLLMLLQDHCEAVLHASTRDEFQRVLVRFAQDLGFGFMAASAVYDHADECPEFVITHNTPSSFLPVFFTASHGLVDPVMQHCKHSGLPIAWDQSTYVRAGRGELWEEMAPHGYQTGISMALHLPHGRHFLFGVDGDRKLPKRQKELARMVADLALVLMYAQDAGFCLLPSLDGDSRELDQQPAMAKSSTGLTLGAPDELGQSKGLLLPSSLRMDRDPVSVKPPIGLANLRVRLRRWIH